MNRIVNRGVIVGDDNGPIPESFDTGTLTSPPSPCERDGHDYRELGTPYYGVPGGVSETVYTFYCVKCLRVEKVKV